MKYIIINLVFFICVMNCIAQDSLHAGGYLSFEEYKSHSPSLGIRFIITQRAASDIRWNGGNDFKVEYPPAELIRESARYKIWAIYRADTLFLNGWRLGVGMWYTVALTRGRYICMEAGVPGSPQLQNELRKNGSYRPVGGIITIGKPFQYNAIRFLYVFDTKNNLINVLDEKNILKILEPETDLLRSFKSEPEINKEIYLKYIKLLNKRSD